MTEVLAAASAALGRELRDLGALGGSDRSGVHRATDGATTVVVKSYAAGKPHLLGPRARRARPSPGRSASRPGCSRSPTTRPSW